MGHFGDSLFRQCTYT